MGCFLAAALVPRLDLSEFRDDSDTMTEHNGGLDYLPETALSRSDLSGLEDSCRRDFGI